MTDENKPSSLSDVGSVGAANTTGREDVQSNQDESQDTSASADSLTKAEIEEKLGRTFKSKEDALNSLENLKRLVGDQEIANARAKADSWSTLVKKTAKQYNVTEEYADLYLRGDVPGATTESLASTSAEVSEFNDPVARTKIATLEHELQTERLLKKYPEAESIINEVEALAKVKGTTLVNAYENSGLKNLAQAFVKSSQEGNSTVAPTGRITPSSGAMDDSGKFLKQYRATGDERILANAIKARLGLED